MEVDATTAPVQRKIRLMMEEHKNQQEDVKNNAKTERQKKAGLKDLYTSFGPKHELIREYCRKIHEAKNLLDDDLKDAKGKVCLKCSEICADICMYISMSFCPSKSPRNNRFEKVPCLLSQQLQALEAAEASPIPVYDLIRYSHTARIYTSAPKEWEPQLVANRIMPPNPFMSIREVIYSSSLMKFHLEAKSGEPIKKNKEWSITFPTSEFLYHGVAY